MALSKLHTGLTKEVHFTYRAGSRGDLESPDYSSFLEIPSRNDGKELCSISWEKP
jgi:hypothetical protein